MRIIGAIALVTKELTIVLWLLYKICLAHGNFTLLRNFIMPLLSHEIVFGYSK